jgi:hypothetical protein
MRSIELIGRYVIPAINTPRALAAPSELPGPVP